MVTRDLALAKYTEGKILGLWRETRQIASEDHSAAKIHSPSNIQATNRAIESSHGLRAVQKRKQSVGVGIPSLV
jgi:hypothetical protein